MSLSGGNRKATLVLGGWFVVDSVGSAVKSKTQKPPQHSGGLDFKRALFPSHVLVIAQK
jgi:hypothetical protein